MNTTELTLTLKEMGANFDLISINDPESDGNEKMTLLFEADVWLVFYAERGYRNNLESFGAESEACIAFLERVKRDHAILK